MIQSVPKFGNKFFYSLGFLSMISFVMLFLTGVLLAINGANWWLTDGLGKYIRSVHLWSTQAFVLFVVLHLVIVFCTSGFKKPRQLTWLLGILMFFFVLAETEFGYVLRGDFSSQWRSLQGADFYNGSGLGHVIDTLNYKQIYGIHIALVPFMILGLLLFHYLLIRVLGIGNPPHKNAKPAPVVRANHTLLFVRGGVLIGLIFLLGAIFPSPFLKPTTIKEIAETDSELMSKTLVAEFAVSSDTAGYKDNIDPYTYDVRKVYIDGPYEQLLTLHPDMINQLKAFDAQNEQIQADQLKTLTDFYESEDANKGEAPKNTASLVVDSLVTMAASGLYEPALAGTNDIVSAGNQTTYITRFLADTGVLEDRAKELKMTTEQYGMLREESKQNPIGAWWLAPIGVLNHTVLNGDENGDRDAAIIFGLFLLLMLAFPFIPWVNEIPEKLRLYKPFQR
jgi:ubiquinol-cytochrome c reductase cytochrome b subunit